MCNFIVSLRSRPRSAWAAWAALPEIVALLTLLVPPITLGTGLFLFFRRVVDHGDALSLGPLLVIVLNALLTLAFGVRILAPALLAQRNRYDQLCASLGVGGWHQWRYILWPALRQPVAYALAVATTLSAGDMGVIALFGTDELSTLPLADVSPHRRLSAGASGGGGGGAVRVVLCLVLADGATRATRPGGNPAAGHFGNFGTPGESPPCLKSKISVLIILKR